MYLVQTNKVGPPQWPWSPSDQRIDRDGAQVNAQGGRGKGKGWVGGGSVGKGGMKRAQVKWFFSLRTALVERAIIATKDYSLGQRDGK